MLFQKNFCGERLAALLSALVLILIFALTLWQLWRVPEQDAWVARAYKIDASLNGVMAGISEIESAQRGFLIAEEEKFLDQYKSAEMLVQRELRNLDRDIPDENQRARLKLLQGAIVDRLQQVNVVQSTTRTRGFPDARLLVSSGKGKLLQDRIWKITSSMLEEEQQILKARLQSAREARELAVFSLLSSGLLASAALLCLLRRVSRLQDKLHQMAMTDHLTGVFNRRAFIVLGDHHLKMARRQNSSCALIFADMDGLKAINDNLGHDLGSEAIAKFAEVLAGSCRKSDLLARYGGDEFVILASLSTHADASTILLHIERALQTFNESKERPYQLRASLGLSIVAADDERNIHEVLDAADRAMYDVKKKRKAASLVHCAAALR